MKFRSTKGISPLISYKDAVLNCLPDDSGLYVPDHVPDFRQYFLHMDENTSFNDLVASVAPLFFKACLNPVAASKVVQSAYNFEPKLIKLDEKISILNLYNGPTGVFKDFGIAFMSAILEEILEDGRQIMILAAARPDTGVSMAHAFSGRKGISLVLLYPSGHIRGLDPSAFVQNGGNIIPIQVKGTFDDCQRLVVETILDREFSARYNVTSANSINPGRLFPQAFYYLYAFTQIKNFISGDLMFSVPCGNFGNLISGLYAWKFGMPVNGFIAAMNANNSFAGYLHDKPFKPSRLIHTNSPALDVSFPLNYERLNSFYEEAPAVMRNMVYPVSIDDETTFKTIEYVNKKYDIFIDPHTAVAFAAVQELIKTGNEYEHNIVLATGDPARSVNTVEEATRKAVKVPGHFIMMQRNCDAVAIIPPYLDAFESAVASCF
ncbi:MAG: threonine synthase [Treponema sp.]|jgi:threonine synthase|nr:threonine synthase [Treponema sp.]